MSEGGETYVPGEVKQAGVFRIEIPYGERSVLLETDRGRLEKRLFSLGRRIGVDEAECRAAADKTRFFLEILITHTLFLGDIVKLERIPQACLALGMN